MILDSNVPVWLGDLNGNTCGSTTTFGTQAAISLRHGRFGQQGRGHGLHRPQWRWQLHWAGQASEIVPFVWDAKRGMRELPTQFATAPGFVRASGISGNGRVIVGTADLQQAVAWVDEGNMINLGTLVGARDLYTANYDGTRVPMYSFTQKACCCGTR